MNSMSAVLPCKGLEELARVYEDLGQQQSTFNRVPVQSMRSDRRIRIYLGHIAERYDAVLKKSSQGFGLTLVDDILIDNRKLLKVKSVYKNGPAAKTGVIHAGDVLSAFNHIDIIGVQPEEVIKMFKVIKEKEYITLTVWKLRETALPYPYDPAFDIIHFYLQKSDSGFGFILGNCNEEHQVAKVNGEGHVTLLLQTNDKLLAIGQVSIEGLSHDQVVNLLKKFPRNHYLQFTVKRELPLLTRSISNEICPTMDYSMNSSIYSKISKSVIDPNVYSQFPGMGTSGPFNTPDFIPASHYLSLNRPKFAAACDNVTCDPTYGPLPSYSVPNTPMLPEYKQPPDCIPEPFKSSIQSRTQSPESIFVQIVRSQTKGFGFRLMGGADEGCQVYIGAIIPGGPVDQCGVVDCGDILTEINGQSTQNKSHADVVSILEEAAKSPMGKLDLEIRKRCATYSSLKSLPKINSDIRIVTLTRKPDEGFGFVIVNAVKANEPCGIGRINPGSVADANPDLHLGDRILAVNGHSLRGLHYKDVMTIIRGSDLQIEMTVRSGNISSLKTIKYELTNQMDSLETQSSSKQDLTATSINPTASQLVSIMKSSSQFDGTYKYNPGQCSIPLVAEERPQFTQDPPSDSGLGQEIVAEVKKGKNGFGFSIKGGADFDNKSLFVLNVAEDVETKMSHKMQTGDEIIEINGESTAGMTRAAAVEKIQSGGDSVGLLLRRH